MVYHRLTDLPIRLCSYKFKNWAQKVKMDEYLSTTMTKWNTQNYNDLTIVVGNESCDLDSAVCAITYAAFLNWQYNQIKCKVCTASHRNESVYKDDIFVPVLNVDKEDFSLKTEVVFCLREHGVNTDNMVFRDNPNLSNLTKTKTSVILVDHHVLSNRDQYLQPYVTEIIDHRPLDKSSWCYKDDTRSTIEIVGSCCTLVTQRIKELGSLVGKDVDFFNAFPVCTKLLHATIILDTVNFSKEVNKATPRDEEIILFLESLIRPDDYKIERKHTLDRLVAARSDVSSLSAAQLLKKDVKIVGDVLVPSFPILVKEFLKLPGALQSVTEALSSSNCSVACLLGMDLTDGLQRDTAVFSPEQPERSAQLSKCLQDWKSPVLQLTSEMSSAFPGCVYYKQMNLSASRKQYMPAINQFVQLKF